MDDLCRLCIKIPHKNHASIINDRFREMIDYVFSFPVTPLESLPIYVCVRCASAVRNFYSYSVQVHLNQQSLETKFEQQFAESSRPADAACSNANPIDNTNDGRSTTIATETISESLEIEYLYDDENDSANAYNIVESNDISLPSHLIFIPNAATADDPLANAEIMEGTDDDNGYQAMESANPIISADDDSPNEECARDVEIPDTECLRQSTRVKKKKKGTKKTSGLYETPKCFSCDDCGRKFTDKTQMIKHQRIHQTTQVPVRAETATVGEFRCPNCHESFEDESLIDSHRVSLKICPVGKKPATALHIARHEKYIEIRPGESSIDCSVLNEAVLDTTAPIYRCTTMYKCPSCEKVFTDQVLLTNHQSVHNKTECPLCGIMIRNNNLKEHVLARHPQECKSNGSQLDCNQCQLMFNNELLLYVHERTHTQWDELFPTPSTSANSGDSKLLSLNGSDDGSDTPQYICAHCSKTFTSKIKLTNHLRNKHT